MNLTPIATVFKVVKVQESRMFSANPNGDLPYQSTQPDSECVEYKLNHLTRPQRHLPALFACASIEGARNAAKFYGGCGAREVRILECFAKNSRAFKESDRAVRKHNDKHPNDEVIPPGGFDTVLCDWLIPTRTLPLS